MKKERIIPIIILAVFVTVFGIAGYKLYQLMFGGAVTVQSADIATGIAQMSLPLIVGGVILAIGIALHVYGRTREAVTQKSLFSVHGGVAIIMALLVTINWVCLGPQYSNLNTAFSGTSSISEEHISESLETAEAIAEEGITLLKNENGALPLSANTKLNVFGWSSTNPVYGGAGSGSSDSSQAVSLLKGLAEAGFELNTALEDFYTAFRTDRPTISFFGVDFTVPEPTIDEYKEAHIFENAKDFSDTALVVIARSSGEGSDLAISLSKENNFVLDENGRDIIFSTQEDDLDASKSYLELSNREIAMLDEVTSDFENVIVVINSAQPMELGWLDEYESINAAIWCPSPGQVGFRALGKILAGEVNPSGHLVDTFVYDLWDTPYINNIGNFQYSNYEDVTGATENTVPFVEYSEGIYVGYKFYETAASEGFIDYDAVVQYPFGYGLSYTNFESKIASVDDDGQNITMHIEVTNKGDAAGKTVAQVYYNPPYYNGGIEKASANLVGFVKTSLIEAGATEYVEVSFSYEDMASYDSSKIKSTDGAYVLEAGDYQINLCSDSHNVIDTYVATVDKDIIYDDENAGKRSSDKVTATNELEYASGDNIYLSRADGFANYEEAMAAPDNYVMTSEMKEYYASRLTYDAAEYDSGAEMPVTGADNDLEFKDMVGLEYDDPKWEELLDELTVDEMKSLAGDGTFHAVAANSINLSSTFETDGPTAVNSFFTGKTGTAFPAPIMVASTWNIELAAKFGESIGHELNDFGFTGWYGPGMNIHRTAFSGRNFEYYSEDGFLSGKIAASEVAAVRKLGIIPYLKHFALNDSETNRARGICTWCTEQAIREIYLKPFEMAVKDGGANGIMNSKNAIGSKWVGANAEVQINILREEWGFNGIVGTDSLDTASEYYEDPNEALRAGTDKMMPMSFSDEYWADESAGTVLALRNASHHIIYTLTNSNAVSMGTGIPGWIMKLIFADILLGALLVTWELLTIKENKNKNKNESPKMSA